MAATGENLVGPVGHPAGADLPGDRAKVSGGVWIVQTQTLRLIEPGKPLELECGKTLAPIDVAYETYGRLNPATGKPYGLDFPIITIADMVKVQKLLLDALGIKGLLAVVGGSIGGMQVLQWAIDYPDFVRAAIPAATTTHLAAQSIAFDAVGRNAILADANFAGAQYHDKQGPDRGLAGYADESFDYVILSQTLQTLKDPERVFTELLRVGRKVIVSFPNFAHWRCRVQLLLKGKAPVTKQLPFGWHNSPNIHFLSLKDFDELCRKLGGRVAKRIPLVKTRQRAVRFAPNLCAEQVVYVTSKERIRD